MKLTICCNQKFGSLIWFLFQETSREISKEKRNEKPKRKQLQTLALSVGSIRESASNKYSAHHVQPRDAAQSRAVHNCAFLKKFEKLHWIFPIMNKGIPVDTGRKLNVHKTFRRRPGRLLKVLCTFNLRAVSTGMVLKNSNHEFL